MFNKEKEKSVTTYIRHNQMISQKKIHKAHHKSNILKKKIIIDGFSGNS